MLTLVLTNRDLVRVIEQDVCGHQHGIGEEAHGRSLGAVPAGLVLELRHPACLAEAGQAGQDPGQLGMLGDMALHEEGRPVRVDAGREVLRSRGPSTFAHCRR